MNGIEIVALIACVLASGAITAAVLRASEKPKFHQLGRFAGNDLAAARYTHRRDALGAGSAPVRNVREAV